MKIIESRLPDTFQKIAIVELWNNEFPEKLTYTAMEDFEDYLQALTDPLHCFLYDENEVINAWAFTFSRNEERWFAIIVSEQVQRNGYGSMLLNHLKDKEPELNGWAIDHNNDMKNNGQNYLSPLGFYQKAGFEVCNDTRLEIEKLSAVKIKWKKS